LFWNPAHFALTPQAVPYFDKLRSAGILFDNPQDAAKKVNEIWHDVQGWWQQPEVQNAKDEFCHQFARTSKNWRKEWSEFLKQLNRKQLNG
jgi:putative transferase (TIGR04331 family)